VPAITNREAATPIGLKVPFTTGNGTLSGRAFTGNDYLYAQAGQLPQDLRDVFVHDRPIYVVYSYATPIAWFSPVAGWVVPSVKYSVTTSRHQGIVRQAVRA
jgi:hypothetical protein